jgi:murein DD-endopeptidase MepM/ murein hydrolase activator NlpD
MKVPRLALFKRNPKPQQPRQAPGPQAEPLDGLVEARRHAYERFRARSESAPAPQPARTDASAPEQPAPTQAGAITPPLETAADPAPVDPLAGLADDTPVTYTDTGSGETAAAPAAADGGDPLDPGLLDIFRDAKQETEESSLAAEVEDIPISELLAEITTISGRLGIDPARSKNRDGATVPAEAPEPSAAPSIEVEIVPMEEPPAPPPDAQVLQVVEDEPDAPVVEERPVVVIQRPQPRAVEPAPEPPADEPAEPVESGAGSESPRRFLLHVLFFGLALGLAATGIGVRGVDGSPGIVTAVAGDDGPTPAVLAFLRPPAIPTTEIGVSHDEHAGLQATAAPVPETPAPSPGVVQTPTPTPEPRVSMPPFFMYTVESGDSYTSISRSLGMCPDHIFWANPDLDENDQLFVGQRLLLPKGKGLIYVARNDDTVADVAERYRSTAEAIAEVPENRVDAGDSLTPGQAILIPGGVPPDVFEETDFEYDMTRDPASTGYVWPFYGPITTYYGEQRPNYVHNAIDIGGLFKFGAPVRAMADGRVSVAQWGDGDYGNYVVVTHDDGSVTKYAHLDSLWVQQGQRVDRSDPLGPIGCTGASTGTHLHLELYINGVAVDPLDYLR